VNTTITPIMRAARNVNTSNRTGTGKILTLQVMSASTATTQTFTPESARLIYVPNA